jgi:uncharacterized protein YecE (DUF72 family)
MTGENVRFGVAGWSYPDWEGRVYPRGAGDRLAYVAAYFDTVEINSSFYRIPNPKDTKSWAGRVSGNPRFSFTVKLFQGFTHREGNSISENDATQFKKALTPLREAGRLGAVLAQFPWSFKNSPDSGKKLAALMEMFREYSLVLEVRHSSWDTEEFHRFLQDNDVGLCAIDQPVLRNSLKPSSFASGKVGYVRLHGRNADAWFREDAGRDARYDYLYSGDELDEWVERIRKIASKKPDTFVIGNNHFRGKGACNILQLKSKFNGEKLHIPQPLLASYPDLEEIAVEPSGQLNLFR